MKKFFVGLFIVAAIAALGWGAYQWYDVSSGNKANREALQAMEDQAKEWQNTESKTIYD